MTSDEVFWRLLMASRSIEEALLLWRLCGQSSVSANRASNRRISRAFGEVATRWNLDRAAVALNRRGLISAQVLKRAYTEYQINLPAVASLLTEALPQTAPACNCLRVAQFEASGDEVLGGEVPGQNAPADKYFTVAQFDPCNSAEVVGLPGPTLGCRIALLVRSRDEAILILWLAQNGAAESPVLVTTRAMHEALLGLVDRRTAMRAVARLSVAGLVSIETRGRAGNEYRLNGDALRALVHQPFPFPESSARMPGWSNFNLPLLMRLEVPAVGATSAVHGAVAEA